MMLACTELSITLKELNSLVDAVMGYIAIQPVMSILPAISCLIDASNVMTWCTSLSRILPFDIKGGYLLIGKQ